MIRIYEGVYIVALSQIWAVAMVVPIALAVVYNECVYEAWKYLTDSHMWCPPSMDQLINIFKSRSMNNSDGPG